jgi:tetratricopeptide (TPR) repeat protein
VRKSHLSTIALLLLTLIACQGKTTGADDLLESGSAHLEAGEYAEAISELEAVVETDPGNSEAHFFLGQAYNRTGDLSKAVDEFNTVLALDPDNAAAYHNLGATYFQLGEPNRAIAALQTALELEPDDPQTHYQIGAIYLNLALPEYGAIAPPDQQLLEQASAEFEEALGLEENMPEALIGMGNVYILQTDYTAAIEVLQQATEQAPSSPEAFYALGEAYAQSGDAESACEAYDHFLTLNPPTIWLEQAKEKMVALGCP